MLLTGSFNRSLDEKLRLAIPKRLRDAMDCPEGGALFLAPGTDVSLAIYSEEAFGRLAERLAQVSPPGKTCGPLPGCFTPRHSGRSWTPKAGCGSRRNLSNWPS